MNFVLQSKSVTKPQFSLISSPAFVNNFVIMGAKNNSYAWSFACVEKKKGAGELVILGRNDFKEQALIQPNRGLEIISSFQTWGTPLAHDGEPGSGRPSTSEINQNIAKSLPRCNGKG